MYHLFVTLELRKLKCFIVLEFYYFGIGGGAFFSRGMGLKEISCYFGVFWLAQFLNVSVCLDPQVLLNFIYNFLASRIKDL